MALKIWLPLVNDIKNIGVSDTQPLIMGTGITYAAGKIGNAIKFPNSCASCVHMPGLKLQIFSWAAWFKVLGEGAGTSQRMLSEGRDTGSVGTNIWVSKAGTTLYWTTHKKSGQTTIELNRWYHVALTADGSNIKLYLDGVLTSTTPYTEDSDYAQSDNQFVLGKMSYAYANTGNYFPFNGQLNDVRVYDHCLSAAEVRKISQGLVLHYKLDGFFGGVGENLVINGDARNGLTGWSNWGTASSRQVITINNKKWFTFKTDANGNYGGFSQDRGIALYKPNTQYTISALMYASANASGRLWVHTRSTEGGANLAQYLTTVNVTTSPALYTFTFNTGTNASYTINKLNLMIGAVNTSSTLDFYISNIKVEEGTKATPWVPCKEEGGYNTTKIQDSSGYGHNGTINGNIAISSDTNRYNYSAQFDGVNDSITVPYNTICPENIFTINLWFKKDALGSKSYETLFGGPSGFEMDTRAGGVTSLSLYMASTRSGNRNVVTSLSLGNWYMITMTRDGTKEKYYINGIFQSEIDAKSMPTGNYYIGAWQTTAKQNYYGLISDFRIYCTPLLDTDIKQLYNVGMKVDNLGGVHGYEFMEEINNIKENEIVTNTTDKTISYNKNDNTYTFLLSPHSSGTHSLWYPTKNRTVTNHSVEIPWGYSFVHTFEIFSDKTANLSIDYNNASIDSNVTLSGNDNDTNRLPSPVSLTKNTWKTVTFSYSNTNESKNPNHVTLYDYSYIYVAAHDDSYTIKIKSPMTYVVDNDSKMSINKNGIISYNQFLESSTKNYGSISEKTKAVEASTFIEM